MCTTTVNGTLTVHEGVRRLRWAHELEGNPPPLHARDWQVAGLWPDEQQRGEVRARLDRGEPVLVILDREPPRVELPVEHVARVPEGVVVVEEDGEAGMVTLEIPFLDWLDPAERARGRAFAEQARTTMHRTPRFLLPALIVAPPAGSHGRLVFALPTRSGSAGSAALAELVGHLSNRAGVDAWQHRRSGPGEHAPTEMPAA